MSRSSVVVLELASRLATASAPYDESSSPRSRIMKTPSGRARGVVEMRAILPASASSAASRSSWSISDGCSGDIGRLLGHLGPQRPQRAMDPNRERFAGASQDGAHLERVQIVVEAEDQHFAVVVGQALERPAKLIAVQCRR